MKTILLDHSYQSLHLKQDTKIKKKKSSRRAKFLPAHTFHQGRSLMNSYFCNSLDFSSLPLSPLRLPTFTSFLSVTPVQSL